MASAWNMPDARCHHAWQFDHHATPDDTDHIADDEADAGRQREFPASGQVHPRSGPIAQTR